MNVTKKSFLALVVAAQMGTSALANAPVGVLAGGPSKGGSSTMAIATNPGDFNFKHYDEQKLKSEVLQILEKRSAADRKFFLEKIEELNQSFEQFISKNYASDNPDALEKDLSLMALSIKSQSGKYMIPQEVFLSKSNQFYAEIKKIKFKIAAISSIDGAFPSQQEVSADGEAVSIDTYGKIDFSEIASHYQEQIDEIQSQFSNTFFKVETVAGPKILKANDDHGLIIPMDMMVSREELEEKRARLQELRTLAPSEKKQIINPYTLDMKRKVQEFIKVYGKTERYRLSDDQLDKNREKEAKELLEIFWTRSYIRAKYGIPLGTIMVDYTKKIANLDRIFSSNSILFESEVAWEDNEYLVLADNYKNLSLVMGDRSKKVFDGDFNFVQDLASSLTFLMGYRSLAEANIAIIELLMADFNEERLVIKAGGHQLAMDSFKARFMTPASKEMSAEFKNRYDPKKSGKKASLSKRNTARTGSSFQDTFATVLRFAKSFNKERKIEIRNLEQYIEYDAFSNEVLDELNEIDEDVDNDLGF